METSNLNLHAMKIYANVGTDCTIFYTAYYTVRAKIRVTFFETIFNFAYTNFPIPTFYMP